MYIPDAPRQNTLGYLPAFNLHDQAIIRLHKGQVFELMLTLASSIEDRDHSDLVIDPLLLEMFYLTFLPYTPDTLQSVEALSTTKSKSLLKEMIAKERSEESVRQSTKNATLFSRHSRFGGTFLFKPEVGFQAVFFHFGPTFTSFPSSSSCVDWRSLHDSQGCGPR